MKRMLYVGILVVGLPFLGGCGKQGAFDRADLSRLEQGFESRQTINDVTVSAKHLTSKDRVYVFGQKNLSFSPVLLTIDNRSGADLFFDTKKQVFTLADIEMNGVKIAGASAIGHLVMPTLGFGLGAATCFAGLILLRL